MKKMAVWYTVNYGAIVMEKVFDTMEDAEREAHKQTCLTGHKWHAEKVVGWDF